MRIASLVPSATEMLFALGLGGDVVGVTHECDYPPASTAQTGSKCFLSTAQWPSP
jgi:iron complex transport system substrate-binding protein